MYKIKEDISARLPPGYGSVFTNFKDIGKIRTGIVIPVCGRAEYLEQCLAALKKSDIKDSLIMIMDETEADRKIEIPGFTAFPGLDSKGGDISQVGGSLADVVTVANRNKQCVAINTLGWCKKKVSPPEKLIRLVHGNFQLFVKNSYLEKRDDLKQLASENQWPELSPVRQTVENFTLDGPLIKVFKTKHSNMYNSLLHGWDLLYETLGCEFLVNLDSDTLVRENWLDFLELTFTRALELLKTKKLLVTGFHTCNHKTKEEFRNFRTKASAGGINLFFHRDIYRDIVRPTLQSIEWDHHLVHRMHQFKGHIVCTRPSVVQHIGRLGLWSGEAQFDQAEDF